MRHGGGDLLSWKIAGLLSGIMPGYAAGGTCIADDPRSSQGHLNGQDIIGGFWPLPTHRTSLLSDHFSSPLLKKLSKCKNRH